MTAEKLKKMYLELMIGIAQADQEDLEKLNEYLEEIQEEDWGPMGEAAASMQPHVEFYIEDRRREGG